MANAFRTVSGLIEVDLEWREANVKVLRQPSAHEPRDSRVIFHETVHYWQQLSQGFLTRMVEEDWDRLCRFETQNAFIEVGPHRREFVRRHDAAAFSAHDLHESLARFWDLHVIGPHRILEMDFEDPRRNIDAFFKEQYFAFKQKGMIVHPEHGGYSDLAFDMAMDASAGNYAMPYRYIRDRFNPVITGTVFPLVGHFALQSGRPVDVFLRSIEKVAPHLEKLPKGQAIHDLWKYCYPLVRNFALETARELAGADLMLTGQLIKNGPLGEHPVYQWMFTELDRARRVIADSAFTNEIAKLFGGAPEGVAGILAIEFCLACPGDTTNRSFLIDWLSPPCVRFSDGKQWLLTDLYRRELVPDVDETEKRLTEERQRAAASAIHMQDRWVAFRRAARGY